MPWSASLSLEYALEGNRRTVVRHQHDGPLRLFNSLYPEGPAICHNVIIHPPGGLVEGDTLTIDVQVGPGAHGLLSTPGATRFYRSRGEPAVQDVRIVLAPGARLEWVPLETIAYPGCQGHNRLSVTLAEGAEWIGWEVTALGLRGSGQPFDHGRLCQRMEVQGHWLEQARLDASDRLLMDAPIGLAGHRCLGTLVLATGTPLDADRRTRLLDAVRAILTGDPSDEGALPSGATCPNHHVLVLRVLGPLVEPVMALIQQGWAALRQEAWGLNGHAPRIWGV